MQKFYVPHKLSVGDVTNLSDQDSIFAISNNIRVDNNVEIDSIDNRYLGVITYINRNNIEVEILEELQIEEEKVPYELILIQSLIHTHKYKFVLEKAVELGVTQILPVSSTYSTESIKKMKKMNNIWKNVIKDAQNQSRNTKGTEYINPIEIGELNKHIDIKSMKLCMSTENSLKEDLKALEKEIQKSEKIYIAIGPEKGWSIDDIEVLKNLHFQFIQLKGNILRTETASLVATSIIKYIKEYN